MNKLLRKIIGGILGVLTVLVVQLVLYKFGMRNTVALYGLSFLPGAVVYYWAGGMKPWWLK